MTTTPEDATHLLDEAARLTKTALAATRYVTTFLRRAGALMLGAGVVMVPISVMPRWWILAVLGALTFGIVALTVAYYRASRSTYPRRTGLLVFAYSAVAVIWGACGAWSGALVRSDAVWWIAGIPWFVAGLLSAAIYWGLSARYGSR